MRVEDRTKLVASARGRSLRKRSHGAFAETAFAHANGRAPQTPISSPPLPPGCAPTAGAALARLRSRRSDRGVAFTEYLVLVSVVALGLGASMQAMQRSMADTGASAGERIQAVINGSVQAPSAILPYGPGANALNRDPVPPYGPRDQGGAADAAHEQIVEDGKRYDKILRDNPGYLKSLPGGTKPTREELAMTDAIVRKYEAELRLHQGEPGFDAVDLTSASTSGGTGV